jgi:GGDEF domain-containing protein
LSPESHLEKRLSLELERAASNDQDLSICFVEYPGLLRGSETYRSVAAGLLQFFGFEDLIFEYGKSSFCVLFPNVELNEAIHLVEDFQKRGLEAGSAEEPQGSRGPSQPLFGLSSRNGRLVEGWRLMREARQALAKARETRGRIMAFKPDPQRYRQFISEKPGAG